VGGEPWRWQGRRGLRWGDADRLDDPEHPAEVTRVEDPRGQR
jgi:hypothetical protein